MNRMDRRTALKTMGAVACSAALPAVASDGSQSTDSFIESSRWRDYIGYCKESNVYPFIEPGERTTLVKTEQPASEVLCVSTRVYVDNDVLKCQSTYQPTGQMVANGETKPLPLLEIETEDSQSPVSIGAALRSYWVFKPGVVPYTDREGVWERMLAHCKHLNDTLLLADINDTDIAKLGRYVLSEPLGNGLYRNTAFVFARHPRDAANWYSPWKTVHDTRVRESHL